MAFSIVQSIEGTRVTSGNNISVTFSSPVSAGSVLIAIVSRQSASNQIATAQVTDGTNKWKQLTECTNLTNYGIDLWICENPAASGTPTVTSTLLAFPLSATPLTGMNMWIAEVSGCTGFELVDAVGTTTLNSTSVTVTSNYATTATADFALTVVTGNMSAATVPTLTTSRLADATQQFWIASFTTGAPGSLSATWTGLTGASTGCAFIVALKATGVSASATHLLQSFYYEPAPPAGRPPPVASMVLQTYPVNPAPGNTLVAFITGATYKSSLYAGSVFNVTDTAGDSWRKMAEAGFDNIEGGNWSIWACTALGGATTPTAFWQPPIDTPASLVLEFANLPFPLVCDSFGNHVFFTPLNSVTTSGSLQAGDLGLSVFGTFPGQLWSPAAGWTMCNSDLAGGGCHQMYINAPAGALTAAIGGGGLGDALVAGLVSSPALGSH